MKALSKTKLRYSIQIAGLGLLFSFLFLTCVDSKKADTVKTDEIHQRYTCNYQSDGSGTLKAEYLTGATWDNNEYEKTGGATVDFGDKQIVTCNGIPLKRNESKISGVYYSCSIPAGAKRIDIVWTDNEGKTYQNSSDIYPFELIEDKNIRLFDNSWKVEWKGFPVQKGEKVTIELKGKVKEGNKEKDKKHQQIVSDEGINYVLFSKETLRQYFGSSIKVSAWRTKCFHLENVTKAEGTLRLRGDGDSFFTKDYRYFIGL